MQHPDRGGGGVPLDAFRRGECILISRNSSPGIISVGRIHLYLALFLRRDYFDRSDSSLSGSFAPQGLFRLVRCISSLFFFSTGIISASRIHLYLVLFLHRDYFGRPDASLAYSFSPQGLFPPASFISILHFFTTGITLPRSDASLSCSFVPQGLF